jgi:hypothetical protein
MPEIEAVNRILPSLSKDCFAENRTAAPGRFVPFAYNIRSDF